MLYIALILSLSTATYFALVAVKRGNDYNRLQERYKHSIDICTMWRRAALKSARYVGESNRKITEREKCITELTNQVNHLKQSTIKAGIILQSCEGCKWHNRQQKCNCCKRNKGMKDCFERSVENEND